MLDNSRIYKSHEYASYRPQYPKELFEWLSTLPPSTSRAWDCGTGNGQVARGIARYFDSVTASDSNRSQIDTCFPVRNVRYVVEPAEQSSLVDSSVDLVTAACAVHWFERGKFFEQVQRVLKPDGVIAIWCYEYPWTGNERVDAILRCYKDEVLKDDWPAESQLYFNRYRDLEFPFRELESPTPSFKIACSWSCSDLINFLSTWTGPINYKERTGEDASVCIAEQLHTAWIDEELANTISLPIYLKVGRL